ncbi:MAG: hypothetical protein RL418_517 [Actinomycetota bacterium]|jgi:O-succinylbenzoate synthase
MRVKFRGLTHREALIFKGTQRWAEFSPFVEYSDKEAARWLQAALSFANDPLPHLYRDSVGINATLPAIKPDQIEQALAPLGKFRTVKIKVAESGQGISDDLKRIQFVVDRYPNTRIRLDANGGFSVDQALELCSQIKDLPIEYFEQPVSTIDEMVRLRTGLDDLGINIPIAADELIRKAEDPLLVARAQAASIAVLKVQPLGGIAETLSIASESGLDVVISSALETSIGISMGLHAAGSLPSLSHDCGLGTVSLLAGDVVRKPLIPIDGQLPIDVAEPEPELLIKYAADPERTSWWLQRLSRCWELLQP